MTCFGKILEKAQSGGQRKISKGKCRPCMNKYFFLCRAMQVLVSVLQAVLTTLTSAMTPVSISLRLLTEVLQPKMVDSGNTLLVNKSHTTRQISSHTCARCGSKEGEQTRNFQAGSLWVLGWVDWRGSLFDPKKCPPTLCFHWIVCFSNAREDIVS